MMLKECVLDFKAILLDNSVSKASAAIVVGILSGFMGFYLAVLNGMAAAGNLEDETGRKINFPEYARIYHAILSGLYCLLIVFCCLLIYGVMKKVRLMLRPWGVTLTIIMILNICIFIAEIGLRKQTRFVHGSSLAKEVIQDVVFTIICVIMLVTVRLQCNHLQVQSEPTSTRY